MIQTFATKENEHGLLCIWNTNKVIIGFLISALHFTIKFLACRTLLLPWSFLIASIVVCHSALLFWFDWIYLHKNQCIYQLKLFEDLVLCHCWPYLLICIVIDHDVNIAAKQCFSCIYALCYISTMSSYHKLRIFSLRESIVLEQPGNHTQSEWIGMEWWSGLFGGRNDCGRKDCNLCVSGYYSDVHGCSNQIIYTTWRCRSKLGSAFSLLILVFDCVVMEIQLSV